LVVAPTATGVGTVGLDSVGRVARLRRETFGVECRAADYIGIGVFPRAFVTALPRRGCLVGDGLLPWLAQGKPVTTILHGGHWSDGGTVPQYLAQNHHWLARRDVAGCERASAGLEDAPVGALVLLDSYLGVGAHSEPGVRIVESVVGHGSQLVGRGELRRCVVWPGAVATAPLADAVVMFDGTVVHGSAVAPEVEGGK
jgi:mannose-1-phosphate guanylyltransferase